jgi:enoyl-CoA hydratase/carnithine racemase
MSAVLHVLEDPLVTRCDRAGVATLTLNRPQLFNGLSREMIAALHAALDEIAKDKSVRVVVIAAAGKAFCAGHDLKEMRSDPTREFQAQLFRECSAMMLAINRLPQPVIARVQGVAAAAGCQLVAACDLAIAADVARFAVSGIKLGLFCSTPAVALSRNMGRKPAFEMLATGDAIDAVEAQRRGLVNRVVPLDQLDAEIERLALSIADKSPIALAIGKQLFYSQLEAGLEAATQLGSEAMTTNMLTEDAQHGFDCFMEKKTPVWKGV